MKSPKTIHKGEPILTIEERTRVFFERIMIAVIVIASIHFIEDVLTDTVAIWLVDLLVVAVAIAGFYLHKAEHQILARVICFFLITGLVFYFAAGTHARNGIHHHFYSIIAITVIIFGGKYVKLALIFVLIVLSLILFLELTNYNLSWFPEIGDPVRSTLSVVINICSAVAILVYAILSLIQVSESSEQRIMLEMKTAQKLNRELDSFVYSASHDLKAPFSSLRGLVGLAKIEKDPAMLEVYLSKMESTIEQSETFINNITNYSRNARLEAELETINLGEFVESIYQDLRYSNMKHPITLQLDLDENTIHSDKNRLKAILGNLLSNSIKYSDTKKSESWIRVTSKTGNGEIVLGVEDNGIGIDPVHLPRLFNMFYRASELSTGSGLGLYIVHESLLRLKGSISVTSKPGEGSKFEVRLPQTD